MQVDVVDLRTFYASPLGHVARRLILRAIRARWESLTGMAVLGLGFAGPFLDDLKDGAGRTLAFMPARQGVEAWPKGLLNAACLVEPTDLPLREGSIDRVLLVHALEISEDPAALMAEIWRVLAPNGHVMIIAPNRAAPWARRDTTPFGHGQPFSRGQVTRLLRAALFTPVHWGEALYMPPITRSFFLKSAMGWERFGSAMTLPFAGVHVIEAAKQVYRPALTGKASRLRNLLPPVLIPSGGTAAGKQKKS